MNRPRYNNKKKRHRGSKFKTGIFIPENTEKYRPPQNTLMNSNSLGMTYRSSWELKFAQYLDKSDSIEYWSSEPFAIPYISPKDNKEHRYFIDFVFVLKNGEKHLIEIKPFNQQKCPINQAKWEAATRYCKQIGATFTIVTEVELKKWGLIK